MQTQKLSTTWCIKGGFIEEMYFLRFYLFIYLFLERREGREKERKTNINVWLPLPGPQLGTWPATQACAQTGNQTCDPLVHRPALNPLSRTSQGRRSIFAGSQRMDRSVLGGEGSKSPKGRGTA